MVRYSDAYCLKGYRLSYNISFKMQTQDSSYKDLPCFEEPKNKYSKPAPPHGNVAIPTKKENKKKKLQRHR